MMTFPPYQESKEFLELLRVQFIETGMDSHPCGSCRWKHHVLGVERVLNLIPRLEDYLSCPIAQARVLDLGCATGSASTAFAWRGCAQVVGLDVSMESLGLKLAKRRADAQNIIAFFAQGNACRIPCASNVFDLCFCDWVIEHIPAPLTVLQEVGRVLAPGGLLYVSTNNRLWPKEAHSGLWGIHWLPHDWAGQFAAWFGRIPNRASWDVWLLTYWKLSSLAKQAGLEVVGTHKDVFHANTHTSSNLPSLAWHLRASVEAFVPNLYLLARKPT